MYVEGDKEEEDEPFKQVLCLENAQLFSMLDLEHHQILKANPSTVLNKN